MNIKLLIGSATAAALMGIGVLAGGVAGSERASAQSASPTPQPNAPQTAPATPPSGSPHGGVRGHGPGGFGGGDFDRGGFGPGGRGLDGPLGNGATADVAARQITNTTTLLNLVKSDLAYANGKMDTADVQRWVNGADALLKSAQSANSSSQYGQAVGYANAARELAMLADSQMAQKLGADKLPSYSQRPQRPDRGALTTTTLTQAQASRILAQTYNHLVAQATLIKSASNAGQASSYLTDAQNAYKAAYSAYQAGKYNDAAASAKVAEQLARVAEGVVRAANAPANADTPVTVPAPNF